MARPFHTKRPVPGAFGKQVRRTAPQPKKVSRCLTKDEINTICTISFYGVKGAMDGQVRTKIAEMKSINIKPIVERLKRLLKDRSLDDERKDTFEEIRAKLQQALNQRQEANSKQRRT